MDNYTDLKYLVDYAIQTKRRWGELEKKLIQTENWNEFIRYYLLSAVHDNISNFEKLVEENKTWISKEDFLYLFESRIQEISSEISDYVEDEYVIDDEQIKKYDEMIKEFVKLGERFGVDFSSYKQIKSDLEILRRRNWDRM